MGVYLASDWAQRASVDKTYIPGISDVVFRNAKLIGRLIPIKPSRPGDYIRIAAITAKNDSVGKYTEGATPKSRGKQTPITTKFEFQAYRGFIGETGHSERRVWKDGQGLRDNDLNPRDLELAYGIKDIVDQMTIDFLLRNAAGLPGMIDDATTDWGDSSRSTSTALVSYLVGSSTTALSTSVMNQATWRSRARPYGADPTLWLAAPLQLGNVAEIMSGKIAGDNANVDVIPSTNGGTIQIGNNILAEMPDLDTGTILGLTNPDTDWGYVSNQQEGFKLKVMGAVDDSDELQISTGGLIYNSSPNRQVKITVSAT